MTGRKPRRAEVNQRRLVIAARMREYLNDKLDAARERNRLDAKARLLTPDGGGSGVTIEMRRISGEAKSRKPATINPGGYTGPNRAERRADARRTGRGWQNRVRPSQNAPYVTPRDTARGDHA